MLRQLEIDSLDGLIRKTFPESIRCDRFLELPSSLSEEEALAQLQALAKANRRVKTYIGQGFHECSTPPVIRRNILENPAWYTQYTPYQAEIAQGRLEALLNFQTVVSDLTGLPIANASLLDESSAAAEAMSLCFRARPRKSQADTFLVSERCHPQTIKVVCSRAKPLRLKIKIVDEDRLEFDDQVFGLLIQYPNTDGILCDFRELCERAARTNILVAVATDILALTLFLPPGDFGADIAIGTTQRLGMGMGLGGPHAAFMATRESLKRLMPGRMVGVSRDVRNRLALRLSLQTREQHIRREKATSNICTAQSLPAIVASMYAVYHGPEGLKEIAQRIESLTAGLHSSLISAGCRLEEGKHFDTLKVLSVPGWENKDLWQQAQKQGISLRLYSDGALGISLSEVTTKEDLDQLCSLFGTTLKTASNGTGTKDNNLARTSPFLQHPVFHKHRSETNLLRYMARLQKRDLSLTEGMIPLGSCTMKLNPTAALEPITWSGFADVHPYEPEENIEGYRQLTSELAQWLATITGFAAVSLQPNAGSQGEYAGLLAIRNFHESRGESYRTTCLIPSSAHGTNPASAQMAGFEVVVVECDQQGNVNLEDLKVKVSEHAAKLAAFMITYPSTHGVFEEEICEMTALIHESGGQVYVDGANMNAMVGLSSPAAIGGDVCHLNLHKTFCIPHGGGGPGMGPICVAKHLQPFLPVDPVQNSSMGYSVASTFYGSGSILPISYSYIAMMGTDGLEMATKVAILNANYIASRLESHYPVLYRGANGFVAHECIVDLSWLKPLGLTVDDVAKRLIDYGFHAPTVSWPVPFSMMIEPTESESLQELDRFCDAMINIAREIRDVQEGCVTAEDCILRHAPYTAADIAEESWQHCFTRAKAALPTAWQYDSKFWPAVSRIDNVWGDRNFVCTCPPIEDYR